MLETVNPATGEVLATFPVHGRRDVDAVVVAAREAAVFRQCLDKYFGGAPDPATLAKL